MTDVLVASSFGEYSNWVRKYPNYKDYEFVSSNSVTFAKIRGLKVGRIMETDTAWSGRSYDQTLEILYTLKGSQ